LDLGINPDSDDLPFIIHSVKDLRVLIFYMYTCIALVLEMELEETEVREATISLVCMYVCMYVCIHICSICMPQSIISCLFDGFVTISLWLAIKIGCWRWWLDNTI